MRIVRDPQYTPKALTGASAAIGNFDGVHLGHQHVLDLARRGGAPLGVVTFEPHPREFFAPTAPPFRLMNAEARAHRLEKLGVEMLAELPFDASLAALSPEAFAREVLAEGSPGGCTKDGSLQARKVYKSVRPAECHLGIRKKFLAVFIVSFRFVSFFIWAHFGHA